MSDHLKASLLSVLLSVSCTTTESPKKNVDQPVDTIDRRFSRELPSTLWSPSKRKVMAETYFLSGVFASMYREHEQAEQYFQKAYTLESDKVVGQKHIDSLVKTNQVKKALFNARRLTLLYPKDLDVRVKYGVVNFIAGSIEKAEKEFSSVLSVNSEKVSALEGMVRVADAQGNRHEAIRYCQRILRIEPKNTGAWIALSRLQLLIGDRSRSLESAKSAYDLNSNDPLVVLVYALVLDLNNKSEKALKLYDSLIGRFEGADPLLARMVFLYKQLGNLKEAKVLIEDAIRQRPSTSLRLHLAFINWKMEDFSSAQKIFSELAKGAPENAQLRYFAARSSEKVGHLPLALDHYLSIGQESSLYIDAQFRAAHLLIGSKDYEQALYLIQRVIGLDDERLVQFYILGARVHDLQAKTESAVEFIESGLKRFNNNQQLLFFKGVYLERLGRYEETLATMKQIIRLDPNNHRSLNFLGYMYADRGEKLGEAEKLIKKALKLKPNDGYYADSLGWVYFKQGNFELALSWLKKAAVWAPGEGIIYEHIAEVYAATGKNTLAYDFFEKALKSRLEPRDKKRIENRLESFRERS